MKQLGWVEGVFSTHVYYAYDRLAKGLTWAAARCNSPTTRRIIGLEVQLQLVLYLEQWRRDNIDAHAESSAFTMMLQLP